MITSSKRPVLGFELIKEKADCTYGIKNDPNLWYTQKNTAKECYLACKDQVGNDGFAYGTEGTDRCNEDGCYCYCFGKECLQEKNQLENDDLYDLYKILAGESKLICGELRSIFSNLKHHLLDFLGILD